MTQPSPLATPMPWNLVASAYAAEVLPSFQPFAEEALRLAAPEPGTPLADVACGPGTLALLAAARGFAVDALDFSAEMVALLERSARERGLSGIRARVGDGQALPYPDRTHGGAFSMFGLMFFPDRARGFAELRRILRPGARAVVSSWQPIERSRAMTTMLGAVQQALPPGAAPPRPAPPLETEEACRVEMGASFGAVEVHPASIEVSFPAPEALWQSMERTMAPLLLTRRAVGEPVWRAVSARARTALAETLGSGPVTLDLNAWLTVGTAGERQR